MRTLPPLLFLTPLLFCGAALASQIRPATGQPGVESFSKDETPTVAFCEMVKNPQLYFDKSIRIAATLEQAEEGQYLSDDRCVVSHDEQIGVGYAETDEKQRELRNRDITKIHAIEYGNRAMVIAVGILRNVSRRDFAWYHYRFDIVRFEVISHLTVPYDGTLQGGITYRAAVRGDKRFGLSLVIPLRMPEHYAARIEWTNLSEFPALKRLRNSAREQQIVFSVLSEEVRHMTERRWNRTVQCKIISVE
jgi:hypothetical protein